MYKRVFDVFYYVLLSIAFLKICVFYMFIDDVARAALTEVVNHLIILYNLIHDLRDTMNFYSYTYHLMALFPGLPG